jgi:signal transduction histidine kinase
MTTSFYSSHPGPAHMHSFLGEGGEMGELTRNFDWSKTSIGTPDQWPQSLQTTLSIILNSKFPMFLWWGENMIQFYNDAYLPSLGNNGKHPLALGQKGEDCWPEIWPVIKPLIDQVKSGSGATWSEDQLIPIYRNGKIEDVYWTFGYSPVKDENGNIAGVLVVCNETTEKMVNLKKLKESNDQLEFAMEERRQAEESLELKNAELLRINNDLDNFIYTASHDLKSPMSNIEGLLNTLKDSILSEHGKMGSDTDMIFQLIQKSIDRFKNTILDLTEIAKGPKLEDEDINELDISQIVEDVKLSIYDKIEASGTTINTDFSSISTLKFSKKNLKSIIYNLLSNAVKYRDKKRASEIFIGTEQRDDCVLIIIKDNGLGIAKEGRDKLFDMFKRFHDHVEGTGVGLYIVKRIMDNAGGRIEVESEEGVGTVFKLYFKVE